MSELVFLNGEFVPYEKALVSVEDRGLLFADGVYEVVRVYGGKPFAMEEHLARLERSASLIRLPLPFGRDAIRAAALELLERQALSDATVYMQATRGPAPRTHHFPAHPRPTFFMIARPADRPAPALREGGIRVITVPDRRWHMCHIKSVGLLLNTLAKEEARDRGVDDALFVRDGLVVEASSSNAFLIKHGVLHTHPEDDQILPGITRTTVLKLAAQLGIPVEEGPLTLRQYQNADEVFLSGTTSEVLPVVEIDGHPVGTGTPGPLTLKLQQAYARHVGAA